MPHTPVIFSSVKVQADLSLNLSQIFIYKLICSISLLLFIPTQSLHVWDFYMVNKLPYILKLSKEHSLLFQA